MSNEHLRVSWTVEQECLVCLSVIIENQLVELLKCCPACPELPACVTTSYSPIYDD